MRGSLAEWSKAVHSRLEIDYYIIFPPSHTFVWGVMHWEQSRVGSNPTACSIWANVVLRPNSWYTRQYISCTLYTIWMGL